MVRVRVKPRSFRSLNPYLNPIVVEIEENEVPQIFYVLDFADQIFLIVDQSQTFVFEGYT